MQPPTLRFAAISDVHLGTDGIWGKGTGSGTIRGCYGSQAPRFLGKFLDEMNTRFKPDFVISLGDMIQEHSKTVDRTRLAAFRRIMRRLAMPMHYVFGNHDIKWLSDEEILRLFHLKRPYSMFETPGFRCIILYSRSRTHTPHRKVVIDKPQLRWLARQIATPGKPILLFNHYPLAEQDLRTSAYRDFFTQFPKRAHVANRKDVNALLHPPAVAGIFAGHFHWHKRHKLNGIPHFTVPSLTEQKKGKPGGEWAEFTIAGKRISCNIRSFGARAGAAR